VPRFSSEARRGLICPSGTSMIVFPVCDLADVPTDAKKTVRENANFANGFKLIWVVQSPRAKYIASLSTAIDGFISPSRLKKRGVRAIVTTREAGLRWTRMRCTDEQRFCGRRNRAVLAPRRWR
jgi:hypothetical protein